jgi:hypothetical protein
MPEEAAGGTSRRSLARRRRDRPAAIKEAEQAVAGGNYDLAWRLANAAINNGNATQQAYAHGIHGEIECVAHNNAEGAAIDLRQARGSARNRILRACHARNLLMEQR